MNLLEEKYSKYALVKEMMETIDIVRGFDANQTSKVAGKIKEARNLLFTGEGSSRIFPAKNAIRKAYSWGACLNVITEGSRQAAGYDLSDFIIFCASNSGRTKEVISLVKKAIVMGNENNFALTANSGTPLEKCCKETFVLKCGGEQAVAATKSVVEQAMFYESIICNVLGRDETSSLPELASKLEEALTMQIDTSIIEAAAKASTIYFAGYNDGVAEELTLKTNEIVRKKSDYLEGTYAVHGIEEVMEKNDVVFVIDPIEEEIDKFQKALVDGVGLEVIAIATKQTQFKTIIVPDAGQFSPYLYLCAGWNLLVETGIKLGVDLDKPRRARKVGNEV